MPICKDRNPRHWIPDSVLKTMTQTDTIRSEFVRAEDIRSAYVTFLEGERAKIVASEKKIDEFLIALEKGLEADYPIYSGPLSCSVNGESEALQALDLSLVGDRVVDLYIADSFSRAARGSIPFEGIKRFLFESRGVSFGDLSMDVLPGDYRRIAPPIFLEMLLQAEPANSPLKAMDVFNPTQTDCARLQTLSLQALSSN